MKTVQIKTLSLLNFKGAREAAYDFSQNTTVSGANGLGKTTIIDAFLWLLFGKNSQGSTVFGLKTYDSEGNVIPRLSHEVSATLIIDGQQEVTLKKVLSEKWVKPRGKTTEEFQGNETTYEVNNVPYKAKDYATYVSDLLPESSFRAVTNPTYFTSLPWQDQKSLLTIIAGGVSQDEITNGDQVFASLLANMQGKDIELYRKEIVAQKNKCKTELETIAPRIDEVKRSMPEKPDSETQQARLDEISEITSANNQKILGHNEELKKIDESLADSSRQLDIENEARQKLIAQKSSLQQRLSDITAKISEDSSTEYSRLISSRNIILTTNQNTNKAIDDLKYGLRSLTDDRDRQEQTRVDLRRKIDRIRSEIAAIQSEAYVPDSTVCPTCHQPLPDSMLEEAEQKFNLAKAERIKLENAEIERIVTQGIAAKTKSEQLAQQIVEQNAKIDELTKSIQPVPDEPARPAVDYESDLRYIQVKNEIENIDHQIASLQPAKAADNTALLNRKARLSLYIDELRKANETLTVESNSIVSATTSYNEQTTRLNKRIDELTTQLRDLNQKIADLEREEDTIMAYKQREVEILETKINSKFRICRWRFYKPLVNGGQEETCECVVNGTPFADANRASQINAGIDIINALQSFYNFAAPVFIDNAESVNTFLPTVAQMITFYVTEDKTLTFKNI